MVGWYSFCIIWTEATQVEDFFGPIRELASKIEQISQVLLVGTFPSVQSEKRLTSLVLCYWWKAWISTDPIGEGFCWCPMRKQVGQHRQSNEKTDWPAPSVQWESGWPALSVQWENRLASTVSPIRKQTGQHHLSNEQSGLEHRQSNEKTDWPLASTVSPMRTQIGQHRRSNENQAGQLHLSNEQSGLEHHIYSVFVNSFWKMYLFHG